MQDHYGIYVKK